MNDTAQEYTTRELSSGTWPDFEALFSRGNGWDHCWCMAFQHDRLTQNRGSTRAEKSPANHAEKRALVESGQAHGVLVYSAGIPVGWCQFGSSDELVIPGSRARNPQHLPTAGWRITCFVTDKDHRRKGVATLALDAALSAICSRGGGIVEAYPVAHWQVDRELGRLVRLHGRQSLEVRQHLATRSKPADLVVAGAGLVASAHGVFGNVSTQGTVSMFEKAGFEPCGVVGKTHVVMRITVRTVIKED
jgi:hypothetical protein